MTDFDRRSGIGGSEVAAALGISPWKSRFGLWVDKTSRDPEQPRQPDNSAMAFGRAAEGVLADFYQAEHPDVFLETGKSGAFDEPIWHPNGVVYAHLDGIVWSADWNTKLGVWEAKTARDDRDWEGGTKLPPHYEAQVRTYLAITGLPWCDTTVMFRISGSITTIRTEANPDLDNQIVGAALDFWAKYVVTGSEPPVDGSQEATAYLNAKQPEQTEVLVADPELEMLGNSILLKRRELEAVKAELALMENQLRQDVGDFTRVSAAGWSLSYKPGKPRELVDWEALALRVADKAGMEPEVLEKMAREHTKTVAAIRPLILREAK